MEASAEHDFRFQRLIGMVCRLNWNPTAYPGGTSLKPIIIDLIWALTGHTIKDLLAFLTILYCVGRDLMAAPFSSANIGIGLFEDDVFSTSWD